MTFIPEELGIKNSNRANFLKYFNRRRLSNGWIRAVSYPAISILAAFKIPSGIQRLNPSGETNKDIISLFSTGLLHNLCDLPITTADIILFHHDILRTYRLPLNMRRLSIELFLISTPPRIGFPTTDVEVHAHDLVRTR
jgi:hypothetical protein